ncbi:MAG: hypothetical protein ACKVQK_22085 [Burkholderiales bacterium]
MGNLLNEKVLKGVNNGVNGCGRSASQQVYEESFELFRTLDALEEIQGGQRYLYGEQQTEAVEAMKRAIFGGNGPVKGNGIVPKGPWLGLERPHNRQRFRQAA